MAGKQEPVEPLDPETKVYSEESEDFLRAGDTKLPSGDTKKASSGPRYWRWLLLVLPPLAVLLALPPIHALSQLGSLDGGTVISSAEQGWQQTQQQQQQQQQPPKGGGGASIRLRVFAPPVLDVTVATVVNLRIQVGSYDNLGIAHFLRTDLRAREGKNRFLAGLPEEVFGLRSTRNGPEWVSAEPLGRRTSNLNPLLRLGDAVRLETAPDVPAYGAAVYAPDQGFADLGPLPEDLMAFVVEARGAEAPPAVFEGGRQQAAVELHAAEAEAPSSRLFETHPDIVSAAAMVALLKADAAGLRGLDFVHFPDDAGGGLRPLPAPVWTYAILRAVQRVGPMLRSLEAVRILFDERADTSRGNLVGIFWDAGPQGVRETLWRSAQRSLAVGLPWPARGEILTPGVRNSEVTAPTDDLNPAFGTAPRLSFLPAVTALAAFAFLLGFQIRRNAPIELRLRPGFAGAGAASLVMAAGLLLLAQASRAWAAAPPGGLEAFDTALLLALFTAVGAALGGGAGYATFRAARHRPEPAGQAVSGSRLRAYLYSDKPAADLAEDQLNFRPLVQALAEFLDNRGTKPPVVLAVNGPWGSGKSSLMSMVAAELEKTGRFRVAWFNAWQYQKQDQILAAFLRSVAAELSRVWGPWLSLRLAWARLRSASFMQLFLLALPIFLVGLAILVPEALPEMKAGDTSETDAMLVRLIDSLRLPIGLLGGGGLLVLVRLVLPFRFSFKWLFAGRDLSGQLGFLDEFQREFRLYREAVGRDKFLIVVDDLDRCNPDAVVEVMKTVNLIVNGDHGPGKTFFVLGFDDRYIVQAIEHEFQDFAKLDTAATGSFGREYLKKIVTVSMSVPVPDPAKLKELAGVLGTGRAPDKRASEPPPKGARQHVAVWLGKALDLARQPLPLVLTVFLVVGAAVWLGRLGPVEDGGVAQTPTAAVGSGVPETDATGSDGGEDDARVLELPPPGEREGGTLVTIDLLAILLCLAALLALALTVRRQRKATPEPVDTSEFVEALAALEDHLPNNPRDLVRLVNRMRVDYLIQAPPRERSEEPAPFAGEALTAQESVTMTLLRLTRRDLFDPAKLDSWLRPALVPGDGDLGGLLDDLAGQDGERGRWADELRTVVETIPEAGSILEDTGKLERYIAVQGHFAPPSEPEAEAAADGKTNGQGSPGQTLPGIADQPASGQPAS